MLAVAAIVAAGCRNGSASDVVLSPGSQNQLHQIDTANYTTIKWIDSVKDFGIVPQGEKVKITFQFLNSGDKPLYIASVRPGCGCTLADYTKSAVLPGKQGEVTAEYDSNHGKAGQTVHKQVVVTCNAKNKSTTVLVFTGNIKAKS
jgi:hypothetical protein